MAVENILSKIVRPYRITLSKIITMHFRIVLVITKMDSPYEFKTTN